MMYPYETLLEEQTLPFGPQDDWDTTTALRAHANILREAIHEIIQLSTLVRELQHRLSQPALSQPKISAISAHTLAQALAAIREAGTAGVQSTVLRDRFRFIRRAIDSGNPLPTELASAGVMLRKEGKGWRYYIPAPI